MYSLRAGYEVSDAVWIAIIGGPAALIVAALIKVLGDKSIERQKRVKEQGSISEAVKIHELTELANVRAQMVRDLAETEVDRDRWQRDYYKLRDEFNALIRRMLSVLQSLRFFFGVKQSEQATLLIEQQIAVLEKLEPPPQEKRE